MKLSYYSQFNRNGRFSSLMEIHEFKVDFRAMFVRVSLTSFHFVCKVCSVVDLCRDL